VITDTDLQEAIAAMKLVANSANRARRTIEQELVRRSAVDA
jgi:hypothetical protein